MISLNSSSIPRIGRGISRSLREVRYTEAVVEQDRLAMELEYK